MQEVLARIVGVPDRAWPWAVGRPNLVNHEALPLHVLPEHVVYVEGAERVRELESLR